jgi:hypothetical protein
MQDMPESRWLIDIFLQYQEALDKRQKVSGGRTLLKDALESDRRRNDPSFVPAGLSKAD